MPLLFRLTQRGLHCPLGDFFIDPSRPVALALVTHAHADHARPGSKRYLTAEPGVPLLRSRLGYSTRIEGIPYGETLRLGDVDVSFHPAGHILGAAQIRVASTGGDGENVWVVSGDYKRDSDPTCASFEVVPCDTFITEATFALPVYRWPPVDEVIREILDWWRENESAGRASVLHCYSLGKAQRILAELARHTDRTVLVHDAIGKLNEAYLEADVRLLPTESFGDHARSRSYAGELILAPPSARRGHRFRRIGERSTGFASGWMLQSDARQRGGYDRGFVISDHADWPALIRTVKETGAGRVLATHGHSDVLARHLRKQGLEAEVLETALQEEVDGP